MEYRINRNMYRSVQKMNATLDITKKFNKWYYCQLLPQNCCVAKICFILFLIKEGTHRLCVGGNWPLLGTIYHDLPFWRYIHIIFYDSDPLAICCLNFFPSRRVFQKHLLYKNFLKSEDLEAFFKSIPLLKHDKKEPLFVEWRFVYT